MKIVSHDEFLAAVKASSISAAMQAMESSIGFVLISEEFDPIPFNLSDRDMVYLMEDYKNTLLTPEDDEGG